MKPFERKKILVEDVMEALREEGMSLSFEEAEQATHFLNHLCNLILAQYFDADPFPTR